MSSMFDSPRSEQFTQGTVFSCAYAENYPNENVYGIVITARCDAAQEKTPIYSYVPVVLLADWMMRDGCEIVLQRVLAEQENTIKNFISQAGLSESLLKTVTLSDIHSAHLVEKAKAEKSWIRRAEVFLETVNFIDLINKAASSHFEIESRRAVIKRSPKILDAIIKELAGNRLGGYYLLRDMPSLEEVPHKDYVVLLREIHHIPNNIARCITKGISKDEWVVGGGNSIGCPRFNQEADFSIPVARLKSPWMEHLMQSLTLLFARIGVENIDHTSVKKSLAPLGLENA